MHDIEHVMPEWAMRRRVMRDVRAMWPNFDVMPDQAQREVVADYLDTGMGIWFRDQLAMRMHSEAYEVASAVA